MAQWFLLYILLHIRATTYTHKIHWLQTKRIPLLSDWFLLLRGFYRPVVHRIIPKKRHSVQTFFPIFEWDFGSLHRSFQQRLDISSIRSPDKSSYAPCADAMHVECKAGDYAPGKKPSSWAKEISLTSLWWTVLVFQIFLWKFLDSLCVVHNMGLNILLHQFHFERKGDTREIVCHTFQIFQSLLVVK